MLKDISYKEKFSILKEWVPDIVEAIKKDLRQDHLKQDILFTKRYFPSKNLNKLTLDELTEGYVSAMEQEEEAEKLGDFMAARWMLKHTEIYDFFEKILEKHYPNFQEIEEIEKPVAHQIMASASEEFGPAKVYLFCVLNSVVFPKEVYADLAKLALLEKQRKISEDAQQAEKMAADEMKRHYEQQIARLTDKYEKKLTGFERKYHQDTENLKKQISNLQKKLAASAA